MKEDLLFGRIALLNNIITKEQLDEVIQAQSETIPIRSLSFILKNKGYIKKNQIKAILQAQRKNLPRPVKSPEERKEDMAFGYIAYRYDYISIDDIVKCLKLQGDIAKKGLLFRLSEILFNEKYLSIADIDEVIALQQKKILHCSDCRTPYNVVGLPAKSRFPCKKCKSILEVSDEIADIDESERLEQYKKDVELGIVEEQYKEKLREETQKAVSVSQKGIPEAEKESESDTTDFDKPSQSTDSVEQVNVSNEKVALESDDKSASLPDESETELDEEDAYPLTDSIDENEEDENAYPLTDSIDDDEDENFEFEDQDESTSREISLDNDEIYAEEMPDTDDVAAKAFAKTKNNYDNILKRKEEFLITTSELDFISEDTYTANIETSAFENFAKFDDDFFQNEENFFEETVYNDPPEELTSSETQMKKSENSAIKIISDKFIFSSKAKIESKDEDTIEEILFDEPENAPVKNTNKVTQRLASLHAGNLKPQKNVSQKNKYKQTRIANIDSNTAYEELDELSEDEIIPIGPHLLKRKFKKNKDREK